MDAFSGLDAAMRQPIVGPEGSGCNGAFVTAASKSARIGALNANEISYGTGIVWAEHSTGARVLTTQCKGKCKRHRKSATLRST
jgi:hypothetical protein